MKADKSPRGEIITIYSLTPMSNIQMIYFGLEDKFLVRGLNSSSLVVKQSSHHDKKTPWCEQYQEYNQHV